EDGDAIAARLDEDLIDLVQSVDQPFATDDELFTGAQDVPPACRRVVPLERLEYLVDREPECPQPFRQDLDFVGLEFPAERVDLDDARYRAELVGDKPIEEGSQLHQRLAIGGVS